MQLTPLRLLDRRILAELWHDGLMRARVTAALRKLQTHPGTVPHERPPTEPIPDAVAKTVSAEDLEIVRSCQPYTMTSVERMLALIDAVRYCVRRGIPGGLAECGVWRGGSVLTMILTLQALGVGDRDLYLYDTFEGMTAPTEHDRTQFGQPAAETWNAARRSRSIAWAEYFGPDAFSESAVRQTLSDSGYPADRIHIVRGDVLRTLPDRAPAQLALLRLDTDWYESTRHELEHLYPALAPGGVLIVDDYGHWEGARLAIDEYFAERPLLLNRIDYTGRIAVKQ